MSTRDWKAVSVAEPCPICGKPDWCTRSGDAVHCMRNTDPPTGWRVVKTCENGAIFRHGDARQHNETDHYSGAPSGSTEDWAAKSESFRSAITDEQQAGLAGALHVSVDSLRSIGVGYNKFSHVYTFPEKDASGNVIGIVRRRPSDGEKKAMPRSRRGLTLAGPIDPARPLLCVEGATDVVAGITVCLQTIGRPSCRGGIEHLTALLEHRIGEVIVLGENDRLKSGDWPGREGAIHVAAALARRLGRTIRWGLPPEGVKDLREWVRREVPDLTDPEACRAAGERILDTILENAATIEDDAAEGFRPSSGGDTEQRKSQADLLVELCAREGVELFHDDGDGTEAFASFANGDHRETWPVRAKGFTRWLAHRYFIYHKKSASDTAVKSALNTLSGQALFQGPARPVGLRIASYQGAIYVDLCDATWRVVRIHPNGWSVITSHDVPVRFLRKKGMLSLPEPQRGGSIDELRPLVNLPNNDDWCLFAGFLLVCFHPRGPYTILCVNGEHGSAKTTLCRLARALIDPNKAGLRRPPREARDVHIAARNGRVVVYTNLSGLPFWLSDTLCSVAYGEGYATRELYTDDDETLFDDARPIMVNGIENLMARGDFADRCLHFVLPSIPDDQRKDEASLYAAFDQIKPRLLGALYDAVACALQRIDSVVLPCVARMADFAKWVVAAEPALPWPKGRFLEAYDRNRSNVVRDVVEDSELGSTVLEFMEARPSWIDRPTALFEALCGVADEHTRKSKEWPKSPGSMSGKLRRLVPTLRKLGLVVDDGRCTGRFRSRFISVSWLPGYGPGTALPVKQSGALAVSAPSSDSDDPPQITDDLSSMDRPTENPVSGAKNGVSDDPDNADDLLHPISNCGAEYSPTHTEVNGREVGEI